MVGAACGAVQASTARGVRQPRRHATASRRWPAVTGILRRLLGSVDGASMLEYAFLIALIAMVIIGAALFFGTELSQDFSQVGDTMQAS